MSAAPPDPVAPSAVRTFAVKEDEGVYTFVVRNPEEALHWAIVDAHKAAPVAVTRGAGGVTATTRSREAAAQVAAFLTGRGYVEAEPAAAPPAP